MKHWENLHLNEKKKKKSTDINAEITKMLELFDKDFKLAIISYYKNVQT